MEGGFEHGDGIAAIALFAQLLRAAEVCFLEQFQVRGAWFLLVQLLGEFERLLEPALADGALDARL